MAVYEGSRYLKTKLNRFRTPTALLEIRKQVKFDLAKCNTYVFQRGDRIDGIAYKIYGNAQLYWTIMDANEQYFSELDIQVGDVLFIPSYREVVKQLGI